MVLTFWEMDRSPVHQDRHVQLIPSVPAMVRTGSQAGVLLFGRPQEAESCCRVVHLECGFARWCRTTKKLSGINSLSALINLYSLAKTWVEIKENVVVMWSVADLLCCLPVSSRNDWGHRGGSQPGLPVLRSHGSPAVLPEEGCVGGTVLSVSFLSLQDVTS